MPSLIYCLDEWAHRQPDALLYTFHDARGNETERYTYRQFAERTAGLAELLRRHGLSKGQRAVLFHTPGLELVVALFACARLGVICTVTPITSISSLRTSATTARMQSIVADCTPTIALATKAQIASLSGTSTRVALFHVPALATDDPPASVPVFCGDTHEILLLQYTSGSTSDPKGVLVSHHNVISNATALLDHVPVGVSWLPQFHDMGLIGYYLFPVVMGGRTHGCTAADFLRRPSLWLKMMSTHRATFSSAPNFGFEYCLQSGKVDDVELKGVDLSHLRVLLNGAEPVQPALCRRFVERFHRYGLRPEAMIAAYGLAEATLAVTRGSHRTNRFDAELLSKGMARHATVTTRRVIELASCGSPLDNVRIQIQSPCSQQPLAEGAVGEISVAGPSVTSGYWQGRNGDHQAERKTGCATTPLRTGDLGFLLHGELYICGRQSDLLIRHGQNYHPQDIEAAVQDDAVRERGVVAFQDDGGRIVLVVEARCRQRLPDPHHLATQVAGAVGLMVDRVLIVPTNTISRTSSGKLSRAATRRRITDGTATPIASLRIDSEEHANQPGSVAWLGHAIAKDPALASLTVEEVGLDSLALVQMQLELQAGLRSLALHEAAEMLDSPSLQQWRCSDVLKLARTLHEQDALSAQRNAADLAIAGMQAKSCEQQTMADDAASPLTYPTSTGCLHLAACDRILLTGATGFFGPFLLNSLLSQTRLPIYVIARGTSDRDAKTRVINALTRARVHEEAATNGLAIRLTVWQGDLAAPSLGLSSARWEALKASSCAIYHNAAAVDYVRTYAALSRVNVHGTHTILALAMAGAPKQLHHVSSTFIFGWTNKGILYEADNNDEMAQLDFGYSQSKWVAEQLVHRAGRAGLPVAIYRPSLISVSQSMSGDTHDVAARLLAFMIRHEVAVDTPNQISLLPADVLANNLVAVSQRPLFSTVTYHLTADHYHSLTELTQQISRDFGYRFSYFDIPHFTSQLNKLASVTDPVFPLLDFFNRSAPHIETMSLKRYNNEQYRQARDASPSSLPDPTLRDMAQRLVFYLLEQDWIPAPDAGRQRSLMEKATA